MCERSLWPLQKKCGWELLSMSSLHISSKATQSKGYCRATAARPETRTCSEGRRGQSSSFPCPPRLWVRLLLLDSLRIQMTPIFIHDLPMNQSLATFALAREARKKKKKKTKSHHAPTPTIQHLLATSDSKNLCLHERIGFNNVKHNHMKDMLLYKQVSWLANLNPPWCPYSHTHLLDLRKL